jgi:hypothetical protein
MSLVSGGHIASSVQDAHLALEVIVNEIQMNVVHGVCSCRQGPELDHILEGQWRRDRPRKGCYHRRSSQQKVPHLVQLERIAKVDCQLEATDISDGFAAF